MKKICFFVHNINGSGGDTKVAVSNINGILRKTDCTISVLTLEDIVKYRKKSYCLDSSVEVECITHQIKNLKKEMIPLSLKIRKYFKKNQFDIVVVSGMDFVPFLFLSLGVLKNTKKVSWEHMNYNVGSKYSLLKLGRKISMKYFNKIIVLSDKDKENYAREIKDSDKLIRIYNPMSNFIDEVAYNSESKRILSCGFLELQKGFDIAIDIAAKVLKEYPDWIWEIWGDGSLKQELECRIKERNLSGRLILRGYADNMMERYKDYSIFALTSRFEGFGMVLVEALQNRLPSVAFDIDAGPSEMIENGENGFLVNAFDVEGFANCVLKLMDDCELRKSCASNARKELYKLDSDTVVDSWIENIINQ